MATKDIVFGQQTITIGDPSIGPNSRWNADGTALVNPVNGIPVPLYKNLRKTGYFGEQPIGIIKPVTDMGKPVCRFGGAGVWTATVGVPTLTAGYTGWDGSGTKTGVTSRTGQPYMLKVVPAANTTETITLQTFATNCLNPALNGKFGLWVYIENLNGFQPTGTPTGSLTVYMGTGADATGRLVVSFNSNQLREGWNFLSFVMRNPLAYSDAGGATEYHPFGVSVTNGGSGANTDIVANPITNLEISWDNMSGTTIYFDSMWTGFSSKAQCVLGCDGGINVLEYALPVFQQYGWVGYFAFPYNTADTGAATNTYQTDLSAFAATTFGIQAAALYAAGWEAINHTVTHPSLGSYTSESGIVYQIEQSRAFLTELGYERGAEFYASPQTSTSRLAESVIASTGIVAQRHARKPNVTITPFGVDNPHYIGSIGMAGTGSGVSSVASGTIGSIAGFESAEKVKRAIDVMVAYGDTFFPFWHGITTTGDTGLDTTTSGDPLLFPKSGFESVMAYIRQKELAGELTVARGFTGFWTGE